MEAREARPKPVRTPRVALVAGLLLLAATAAPAGAAEPRRRLEAVRQWQHDWARGAVFYEIFVRSFADSDGDGVGDLQGLIDRLDYLNDGDPATSDDLGVDALWLMPIFASPSYHGYDVTDYESINPDYGSVAAFERLCEEAHRRGIRVIIDFVVNHSGSGHPWFEASASSPSAPMRDWYVWRDSNPGWTQPWGGNTVTWHPNPTGYYYGLFWSGMPDLNFRNPQVRAEVKRLAALWLGRGADGFRLDAARYLIETGAGPGQQDTAETHGFWREFSAFVRALRPDATLVGEDWADTATIAAYFGSTAVIAWGDELPMNFNFPLSASLIAGIAGGNATGTAATLAQAAAAYPSGVSDAPFLTNHDQVRVASQLGGQPGRLRNAAAVLLTLPGAPFVYYGEEVGIQNGTTSGDESKRTPMPWDNSAGGGFTTGTPWFPFAPGKDTANVATQTGDGSSLLSRYRALIRARAGSPGLRRGEVEVLSPSSRASAVLAFLRVDASETVLVTHNLSDSFVVSDTYAVTASGFERVFTDPGVADPTGHSGAWRVALPPRSSGVWRLR
jgi:glycosidase